VYATNAVWGPDGQLETFSYDGTHRLASVSGPSGFRSYTHDARGNVTGRPGFTHVYDAVNRLIESQPAGGNLERYEYDGHGRRTAMVRSNGSAKIDYYTRDGVLRATADQGMGTTRGSAIHVHLGDARAAKDAGGA
jgi:YD repeat-containing protein